MTGAGIGSAVHGFYGYSFGFCIWAVLRSLRRFVVVCLDTEDASRLFKYEPDTGREHALLVWLNTPNRVWDPQNDSPSTGV